MAYTDTGTATSGNGSVIQLSNGASPPVYTTIALLGDIGGFGVNSSKLDTSHQNNPFGYKTFTLGLKDPGDCNTKVWWDPDDTTLNGAADGLWDLANTQEFKDWRILEGRNEATDSYFLFNGPVMKMTFNLPVDGIKNADVGWAVSGKITHSSEL